MPKIKRNKEFVGMERKIRTDLIVQKISPIKEQVHFDEFKEMKRIISEEAKSRDMSMSEFIRWLIYRWLSVNNKISVEIEKKKILYLTDEDLEIKPRRVVGTN